MLKFFIVFQVFGDFYVSVIIRVSIHMSSEVQDSRECYHMPGFETGSHWAGQEWLCLLVSSRS